MFADVEGFDYSLKINSPCIGTGRFQKDRGAIPFDWQTDTEAEPMPKDIFAISSHPNPFNVSTMISYDLPYESAVTLEIYDILGRRVETLVSGVQPAGAHSFIWNAEGRPSCLYYYRITAGDYSDTGKCILLK